MHPLKRSEFLRKIALTGLGILLLQKAVFSRTKQRPFIRTGVYFPKNPARVEIANYAIIDMHCHPSLGMYMTNKHFWRRHHPFPGENVFHMQEDLHQLSFGNVRGLLAAHYLPEATIKKEWATLKKFYPILNKLLSGMTKKLEHEDPTNYDQIVQMITLLESQMNTTNNIQSDVQFKIVRSYQEFEDALKAPVTDDDVFTIPIAHAIEGSHALGRNFPISVPRQLERIKANDLTHKMTGWDTTNADKYIDNLMKLSDRGVCLMSLAHFFKNDLVYPVDGISPDAKRTPGMAWEYTPDQDRPLSVIGAAVVRKMFEIGMIVDLTHCAPGARRDVFKIYRSMNKVRVGDNFSKRPVVFTHSGAQKVYEFYDQGHYPYYKYYDASDEEIRWISQSGGVIGVIPENFWLVGADTHLKKEFPKFQFRDGIPYMLQTMKYINSRTVNRDYSNIAIGTDFDGLADNPRDLYRPQQLNDLFNAMLADPELQPHVEKITWRNALRVLQCGWGAGVPLV